MFASGAPDFQDIIWPLLESDDQNADWKHIECGVRFRLPASASTGERDLKNGMHKEKRNSFVKCRGSQIKNLLASRAS